ncbi:uncharacterized protein LOC128332103 [Hemicordylus capensis]|uniref:uncharacterized protein LOC128332103 n=1 Tax=Hemicordylus capensis TaxID=884348 RepID=UPI0023023E95|nr:uncharacterized protein LOC128332103 [Hemicordylus capensis]
MSDFSTPLRPVTLPLPMAPVKPRRGRSKYGLMRSLSYSPPTSLKNGQDLDSCATPEGVPVKTENRDPQEVEWESESREPPGTALKQRNMSSSSSESETEAPVKPKLRRKKQWVRSRPHFDWCDEQCCDSSCGEYTYSDECGCGSELWSSRPRVSYCVLKCCSSSEDWSSCECETPSPSQTHYSYCRAVCFTSASESEEDVTDGCVLTTPAEKTAAEEQDEPAEEPSMGTGPRESEEAVVETEGRERVPPNPRNARNFENMHLGDVNVSCITCVCAENDQ